MQNFVNKKFLAAAVIIVALAGFFIYRSQANSTPELQFAQVKKQDISSIISSSGTLTGTQTANLKFKSSGRMAFLNVKPDDKVLAFQIIAGLDTRLLEIDLQQAQNTLRDKEAIVQKIEDDVKDHAKDESFKQKVDRTSAQAARDSAFDEVKASQKALADAYLYTPITGVVTQAPIIAGQNVSSTDLIAQIVNITSIYFDSEIDEADIGKIKLGQKALVALDAYPNQEFEGDVSEIIPQTKTTSSGATVIPIRIKLNKFPDNFVNGLSGQAAIIISKVENALTIPLEALREDNVVVLKQGSNLQEIKVIPGIQSDIEVEIKSGLQEGDQIILNPLLNLQTRSARSILRFFR